MKYLLRLSFLAFAFIIYLPSYAQPSRDMTAKEVEYTNRVSNELLNSLPKEFKDWNVDFPQYTPAVLGETRTANCDFGKDCFYNLYFHVVYDGMSSRGPDFSAFQDSMKHVAFDWHYAALFGRFQNTHQLVVDISVNETLYIGNFKYCGEKGYQTITPPAGFDHYVFATVSPCFPKDGQQGFPDVNLFIIGDLPTITDHLDKGISNSSVLFTPSTTLTDRFKVQNVVVRMIGSKALAKEFLSKMDVTGLRKLVHPK